MYSKQRRKYTVCINCGHAGHTSKHCNYPVTSYGILCYHIDRKSEIQLLMVQRKDSLSFVDMVRGKYRLGDIQYIKQLVSTMTFEEQDTLMTADFDTIWTDMWGPDNSMKHPSHINDYKKSSAMFRSLRAGYILNRLDGSSFEVSLHDIVRDVRKMEIPRVDTEWEFPKGRRMLYESDVSCARREFFEETGLHKDNLEWCGSKSFEEIYTGTNGIRYRNVYYLGEFRGNPNTIGLCCLGSKQKEEVKNIAWVNIKHVKHIVRENFVERKELIPLIKTHIDKLRARGPRP